MQEQQQLTERRRFAKAIEVLCHPTFPRLPFSTRTVQKILLLPLVTIVAIGVALFLLSYILPILLVLTLSFFPQDSATGTALKPILDWSRDGMSALSTWMLSITLLLLPVIAPLLFVTEWLQGIATHIRLHDQGICFYGQILGLPISTSTIPWSALITVNLSGADREETIELPILTKNLNWTTRLSLFLTCPAALKSVSQANLKLHIPLRSLPSQLERERLVLALSTAMSESGAVLSTRNGCPTYTELWLEGLSPETSHDLLAEGSTIGGGRYQIEQLIGSGGEGVVYSAQRVSMDNTETTVAIKEFVLPVQAGFSGVARALEHIERENELLSRLSHPGIIKLFDYFVERSKIYLVLELLTGQTLNEVVEERGPLPEAEVTRLAIQMCEILTYLHSQVPAIIHRDFTPDNLVVLPCGTLKLIDFNVAQQLEASATQDIVGKQAYIPPEQFRGKSTTQSDLYALGATLYFLLTAEDPEPITVLHPREKKNNISPRLDSLVTQLTQQDASLRIQQASLVHSELLECQASTTGSTD